MEKKVDPSDPAAALRHTSEELDLAYRLLDQLTDPRAVDEVILRIRALESRLDNLTHAGPRPERIPLLWLRPQPHQASGCNRSGASEE